MANAATFPLLSDGTLPPLALMVRWLAQARRDGAVAVRLERLPLGNGTLPDLLRLAGFERVELANPPIADGFRWEGCAGGRVTVNADGDNGLPLHHGHLPIDALGVDSDAGALAALVDLARLEDASALCRQGDGAAWEHILAAAGLDNRPAIPPLAGHTATAGKLLGAWNPLPFARQLVVSLPLGRGTPPWAVEDDRGARHPVQVVEGPLGRELLAALPLGALQCARLSSLSDPVPGAHWEVSRTVLDNGRLRAELDPLGQVVRLCCNGRFAALSGPALHALVDGLPLSGATTTTVLEEGPVRARVAVSRIGAQGSLHLSYTLHAHEDALRIAASWDGAGELTLDHPTAHRGVRLRLGGELAGASEPQAASVLGGGTGPLPGVRWAALGDAGGQGLGLAAPRPLAVSAHAGHLRVHVERSASFAICGEDGPSDPLGGAALSLARFSLALAVPGRVFTGEQALPAAFHLQGGEQLVPCWVSRPAGWAGELLACEVHGRRARTVLSVAGNAPGAGEAWRVDCAGQPIDRLPATPEGDGFEIEAAPNEVVIVRWK